MNLGSKSNRFNNYMETITLNCGLKTNKHPNFLNRNFLKKKNLSFKSYPNYSFGLDFGHTSSSFIIDF